MYGGGEWGRDDSRDKDLRLDDPPVVTPSWEWSMDWIAENDNYLADPPNWMCAIENNKSIENDKTSLAEYALNDNLPGSWYDKNDNMMGMIDKVIKS